MKKAMSKELVNFINVLNNIALDVPGQDDSTLYDEVVTVWQPLDKEIGYWADEVLAMLTEQGEYNLRYIVNTQSHYPQIVSRMR